MMIPTSLSSFLLQVRDWYRMHPLRQRFLLGIGVGVLTVGSTFVVLLYDKQVPKEERQLALVERRTIISSVKATGTVTFSSEQQLKFNQR